MKTGGRVAMIGGIVAAAVLGVGVAWWLTSRPPSIEDAAQAYLEALADGDGDEIARMAGWDADDADAAQVLAAFAGAESYISDAELGTIESDHSGSASATLGGETVTVSFGFEQTDAGWTLASDFLAGVQITTTIGDSVWIGDALVPASAAIGGGGPATAALLPALYPIDPAPRALLDGGTTLAVSNEEPVSLALEATLAPDAAAVAQAQLDAYISTCTQAAASVPPHCGLRVPWAADLSALSRLAFRIEQQPVLAFSPDASTFAATGGALVATATGTARTGGEGSFTYRADDWALRGTATFTGDELVLAVD